MTLSVSKVHKIFYLIDIITFLVLVRYVLFWLHSFNFNLFFHNENCWEKQIDWQSSIEYTLKLKKYTLGGDRIV